MTAEKDSKPEELVKIGQQAKKLKSNRYFNGLMEDMEKVLSDLTLKLGPTEVENFKDLASRRTVFDDIRNTIASHIARGEKAERQLSGEVKPIRKR